MWLSVASAFISVVSLISISVLYRILQEKHSMSESEQFVSLDRDLNPDYNRFEIGRSTFTTFDFHAEPQGYVQIGRFMLNWGPTDHSGNFSNPFDVPFAAVAIPTRWGGGEDNLKVAELQSSWLRLRANGCERPGNFLACGLKSDKEKVSRITVNDLSNKTEEMKKLAYVSPKQTYNRKPGNCGGPC